MIDLLAAKQFMAPKSDGIYGPLTAKAVQAFKQAKALPNVDGTHFGALAADAILKG